MKIDSYAELIAEYPALEAIAKLSVEDALIMVYKIGRLDGQITELDRQAIRKEWACEIPMLGELVGRA